MSKRTINPRRQISICGVCKLDKPPSPSLRCVGCYRANQGGLATKAKPKLALEALSAQEKAVYGLIMRLRKDTYENRQEALLMVQMSVERGELDKEQEFWAASSVLARILYAL